MKAPRRPNMVVFFVKSSARTGRTLRSYHAWVVSRKKVIWLNRRCRQSMNDRLELSYCNESPSAIGVCDSSLFLNFGKKLLSKRNVNAEC